MKTINVKKASSYQEALDLNQEITGTYFYKCFENSRKDKTYADVTEWFVAEDGTIRYIWTDERFGLKILNTLTLYPTLTNGGFNSVIIIDELFDGDEAGIVINEQNWDKCNRNRKILAEREIIVTGEAA